MLTRELLAGGYTDKAIARLVRRGVLVSIRHGAYAYADMWPRLSPVERRQLIALAVLRSARSPVALSGPSAAEALGVPVWEPGEETHLLRLDGKAGRREAGRVEHRGHAIAEDLTFKAGRPITSGTRTAIDMIAISDTPHALVTVNGLLNAGETTLKQIEYRMRSMRTDPHLLNSHVVLGLADPRIESAGESLASWMFWRQHLPRPTPQYEVRNRNGRVIHRVDFAWPELGVFLEFDGKEKYLRHRRPGESVVDAVLREKRREELICGLTGWRCIRIIWSDLFRAERTAARILATLEGRPWAA
ncbi:type IV toxin-antitoxin system AbiEi family antitoxin domain-containing protein [Nocardioides mangrovi]|uniref:Type IV toxin-antitoxin system AbiEi family antitoxin domain-containing protein n=1 Tax=Nocardioides mangrovi TaxID=2874580 RepID=A0ABS7U9Y8_9ACTN|nr:type IV toxin-antitoxin system AbiEi family antitoxin domain-containing protein [Nocardioides mangrovi]MBZ5737541.1 type IV toxin-antitoxin system AbiEi family antitoxin domain-containing protein [Nocardioides mangrovi]